MRTTWLVGFPMLWVIGTYISVTIEMQYPGTDTADLFYAMLRPDFGSFTNPLTAIGGFFMVVWDWIQALWIMVWWDYSFLTGVWEVLKLFGFCLSLAWVVSLVLAIRGTGSG